MAVGMKKAVSKRPVTKYPHERITIAGATSQIGPLALWMLAADFHASAELVARNSASDGKWRPSEKFLACRAVELLLKAFLSLKGYPLMQLSGGVYGHDLQNLLEQADAHGLAEMVPLSAEERWAMECAATYYRNKVFEYPALVEAVRGYGGDPSSIDCLLNAGKRLIDSLRDPALSYE
jgi:hypothetical protein